MKQNTTVKILTPAYPMMCSAALAPEQQRYLASTYLQGTRRGLKVWREEEEFFFSKNWIILKKKTKQRTAEKIKHTHENTKGTFIPLHKSRPYKLIVCHLLACWIKRNSRRRDGGRRGN
jgi:hypothetical protein